MLTWNKGTRGQLFIILWNVFDYPRCTDSRLPGTFPYQQRSCLCSVRVGTLSGHKPLHLQEYDYLQTTEILGIPGITGSFAPEAATSGTMTVAILAAALAGALPLLPNALGGGPLYLLVSEWRNAHDLALHALHTQNIHGVLAFSAALILATFLASSPRGVVLPFGLGGGGLGPDCLAFGFAFGAGAAFTSSFVFLGCGLPPHLDPDS